MLVGRGLKMKKGRSDEAKDVEVNDLGPEYEGVPNYGRGYQ
jgi:hypothetical protein